MDNSNKTYFKAIMGKELKNLKEHNKEASDRQYEALYDKPLLNGIACPKCGSELYDTHPKITLMSMPTQKEIHCSKCSFKGYRVV